CPIRSRLSVRRAVLAPRRAEADAASQPAWPPPMTITSKFSSKIISNYPSLADAEGREDLAENVLGGCFACNLPKVAQRIVQANQDQFFARAITDEPSRCFDRGDTSQQQIVVARVRDQQAVAPAGPVREQFEYSSTQVTESCFGNCRN